MSSTRLSGEVAPLEGYPSYMNMLIKVTCFLFGHMPVTRSEVYDDTAWLGPKGMNWNECLRCGKLL